jgi:hypothetical protein
LGLKELFMNATDQALVNRLRTLADDHKNWDWVNSPVASLRAAAERIEMLAEAEAIREVPDVKR